MMKVDRSTMTASGDRVTAMSLAVGPTVKICSWQVKQKTQVMTNIQYWT